MITGFVMIGLLAMVSLSTFSSQAAADDTCSKSVKDNKANATATAAPTAFDKMPAVGTKAKCLIMDQEFTVSKKTASSTYKGKTYVFCCPGCKPKFEKNPEKYLKK
jgi:YHS domain-containing protein